MARLTPAAAQRDRADGVSSVVHPLPVGRSDEELVAGLREGEPWARAALFDRYGPAAQRVLRRLLGPEANAELADLVQDVFVQALSSLDRLRDAQALSGWMRTIATRTAYRAIRRYRTRRWLRFWDPSELPEIHADGIKPELTEAYARTYQLLQRMPAMERVAFVLRHVEKAELKEIAEACGVSLATIKRRLARAQQRFARAAAQDPVLCSWLQEGGRWTS